MIFEFALLCIAIIFAGGLNAFAIATLGDEIMALRRQLKNEPKEIAK